MDRTTLRDQLYAQAQRAYDDTVASNVCFDMADVHAHLRRRVNGEPGAAPEAQPFEPHCAVPFPPRTRPRLDHGDSASA